MSNVAGDWALAERTTRTHARLFEAAEHPHHEVRDAAASWAVAFQELTVEIRRAEKILGPASLLGLDRSGQDGVAAHGLARYQRAPPIDPALVVRAIQDATIDCLARSRTLSVVLDVLERKEAKFPKGLGK